MVAVVVVAVERQFQVFQSGGSGCAQAKGTDGTDSCTCKCGDSTSSGQAKGTHCHLFATGQLFAQKEVCKLISLLELLSVIGFSILLLFCACANCEWNGMGACQDQALCVGCVDLHCKSA